MAKMMSPNTTIWWVPSSVAWDVNTPSAALLTTARNISCAIVTGYTLGVIDSDKDNSKSICASSNVDTPTRYNYDGALTFFRSSDMVETTSDFAKAFAFFKNGRPAGWLVRRIGYLSTVAAAAGQVVSSFAFIADNPQDVVADGGPIEFTVKFLQQGSMGLRKTLVA